ncbi:hypothetical protein [Nocardia suismassiliense]|uniref:hypothetical protein n=1 Tax=Nocardia suismassiliense TaxID=2077092 RepID=UPI00389920DB
MTAGGHRTGQLGESRIVARRAILAAAAAVRCAPQLAAIGFALGRRPEPAGLTLGALVIALGTATLAATVYLAGIEQGASASHESPVVARWASSPRRPRFDARRSSAPSVSRTAGGPSLPGSRSAPS